MTHHRSVRGKHAFLDEPRQYRWPRPASIHLSCTLQQQFEHKQAGMALVHVELSSVSIAECAQNRNTTNPQHDLLAQPIMRISI